MILSHFTARQTYHPRDPYSRNEWPAVFGYPCYFGTHFGAHFDLARAYGCTAIQFRWCKVRG